MPQRTLSSYHYSFLFSLWKAEDTVGSQREITERQADGSLTVNHSREQESLVEIIKIVLHHRDIIM